MENRVVVLIGLAIMVSIALLGINILMVWLYIRSNGRSIRLTAAVQQLQRDLINQAEEFRAQLASQAREYDLKLEKEVQAWIDQRQRHWVTARHLLVARQWIRQLLAALKAASLAIPVPDNVDEVHVADESIYRGELERAAEYHLDDLIEEARRDIEATGPVDAVTTETGAP
jgi:hypothetical protein